MRWIQPLVLALSAVSAIEGYSSHNNSRNNSCTCTVFHSVGPSVPLVFPNASSSHSPGRYWGNASQSGISYYSTPLINGSGITMANTSTGRSPLRTQQATPWTPSNPQVTALISGSDNERKFPVIVATVLFIFELLLV